MLRSINEVDWVKFINQSINTSIYHHPVFLNIFQKEVDYRCFFKGDEPIIGIPLMKGEINIPYRFQCYNGFLYSNRKNTKDQKVITSNFKALEDYANYFFDNYKSLTICCDDTLVDTRPFIWHNYPNSSFKIDEFYTSKLLFKNFSKEIISESRRQDIKKSEKLNLKIEETNDINSAVDFFLTTVKTSDYTDDEKIYTLIINTLLKKKMGKLLCCRLEKKIVSYIFFGTYKNKVYYIFAGSDKNLKNISFHSLLIYECLKLFKNKYEEFDFVGVNSPLRGSFKLSFGGKLNRCWKLNLKK